MVNDKTKKVDADERGQLGLTAVALAELIRNFDDIQVASGRKKDVDQDLETVG